MFLIYLTLDRSKNETLFNSYFLTHSIENVAALNNLINCLAPPGH